MSRSYKKNPYVTDKSAGTKSMKRIANRIVRRRLKDDEDMPARLQHKKMTESWDICTKWSIRHLHILKSAIQLLKLGSNIGINVIGESR